MGQLFLILSVVGYLIYRIAFEVPKNVKKTEEKIDALKTQMRRLEIQLKEIDKKLDNK